MNQSAQESKNRKAWIVSGLLVFFVAGFFQPAMAQSQRDVESRISRLENEIDTLNRAVYKGEAPASVSSSGGAVQANTEVRLQQMEREVRDLRGSMEEQSYAVRQMKDQLDRALADMEMRFGDIEGGGSARTDNQRVGNYPYGGASPAPSAAAAPAGSSDFNWSSSGGAAAPQQAAPVNGQLGTLSSAGADKAASMYENAFSKLKNSQYDEAETEFQAFIDQYPGHVLTSNAKYWLGETFYVRGSFERAARIFAEGYKQYPTGSKAPDNLLKLGMSLSGLGNKADACVAFGQLQKEFSGKSQPVIRRAQQEMSRIGCS